MILSEFQRCAQLTEKALPFPERFLHAAVGVAGECGELIEALSAEQPAHLHLREEIGDLFWYLSIIPNATGTKLEDYTSARSLPMPTEIWMTLFVIKMGAFVDSCKRLAIYEKKDHVPVIKDATFDLVQHLQVLIVSLDYSLEDVLEQNIDKLKKRYGAGHFDNGAANERADKQGDQDGKDS